MIEQLLLTEPEAAERLRVCTRTLRKARQAGKVHYVLMGRKVLYTVTDLESFIESLRKVQTACTPPKLPGRSSPAPRAGGVIVPFRERNKRR